MSILLALLLLSHPCHSRNGLADHKCTPGSTDPRVTQATIHTTICLPGYTAKVRPSARYTAALKLKQMALYGITGPASAFEEDHLIPLELGGSSNPDNLWPEPGPSPNPKDAVENLLHRRVCSGQITLKAAQRMIRGNWRLVR